MILIPFFGRENTALEAALRDGHALRGDIRLLPLDPAALEVAHRLGLPWECPDARLADGQIATIASEAEAVMDSWFAPARDLFTVDGVCWPELDREAMVWFWRDALYARRWAKVFAAQGTDVLGLLPSGAASGHKVYYQSSGVVQRIWAASLKRQCASIGPAHRWTERLAARRAELAGWRERWRQARRLAKRPPREIRLPPGLDRLPRGGVLLVLNLSEIHRLRPVITRLQARFAGELCLALSSGNDAARAQAETETGLPTLAPTACLKRDPKVAIDFERAWRRLVAATPRGEIRALFDAAPAHFAHFARERWPTLVVWHRHWSACMAALRPRLVLVSALEDAETQLVALAARAAKAITVAVPHGAIYTRATRVQCDWLLVGDALMGRAFRSSRGLKLARCRDLLSEDEYVSVPLQAPGRALGLDILVLLNPAWIAECAMPYVELDGHLKALHGLDRVPPDLAGRVNVRLKVHPAPEFAGGELVQIASAPLADRMLPRDTGIAAALDHTDLVVCLNGFGSVLLPVVRRSLPVIFFWPDPGIGVAGPFAFGNMVAEAGTIVRTTEQLWTEIRRLLASPSERLSLGEKSRTFYEQHFSTHSTPHVEDVLGHILDSGEEVSLRGANQQRMAGS